MTKRNFAEKRENICGVPTLVCRVECSKCHISTSAQARNAHGKSRNAKDIAQEFTSRGWAIGKTPLFDFCPSHKPAKGKSMSNIVPLAPKADAPREMSRDDKRIIVMKLNEVYRDDGNGYESGWSDIVVAENLGVPAKWVETLRSEIFGESGIDPDMAAFSAEALSVLGEARKAHDCAQQSIKDFDRMLHDPRIANFAGISARLEKLETLAESIRKHQKR